MGHYEATMACAGWYIASNRKNQDEEDRKEQDEVFLKPDGIGL